MSVFSRFAWVALLGASSLPAVTITGYSLQYKGGSVAPGAGNISDAIFTGDGFYIVDGTLGLFQAGVPVALNTPLNGPFSFRFTDATILCNGFCAPTVTLNFTAFVTFATTAPNVGGSFGVDGAGPNGRFVSAGVEAATSRIIANIPTNSAFSASDTFPAGFLLTASNTTDTLIFLMGLEFSNGLGDGEQITLPSSLFQQLDIGGAVPEPGTLAMVGAGLAGALWFRRRLN